ncbi:MAG: hypothetical protein ABEK12_02605 [Candidatus Nanohaloarchaea archaeon]
MPPLTLPRGIAAVALLWTGMEGVLQYRSGFCAGFAHAGVYDVGGGEGRETVDDPADRAADRRRAVRLHAQAGAAALAVMGIAAAVLGAV